MSIYDFGLLQATEAVQADHTFACQSLSGKCKELLENMQEIVKRNHC